EMITGTVPFDADNLMGILTKHLYEEPRPPSELRADLPPDLEKVVMRCMSKSTEQRYQSMQEVLEDILRVEQGIAPLPMPARTDPSGAIRYSNVGRAQTVPPTQPATKRALPFVAAAIAVLAVVIGGVETYLAFGKDTPPPE